jgi:ADP-ribose pyrophosphatase YjhB (NUDIX family)
MARRKVVTKVTIFITRDGPNEPELLLLRHKSSAIQLPGGIVHLGESIDNAVSRVVADRTGLDSAHISDHLGTIHQSLPENQRITMRMTKIFDAPSFDASSAGYALDRGETVLLERVIGRFASIRSDPLDESLFPTRRVSGIKGFVRLSLLATTVERHFYHLASLADSPKERKVDVDGRQIHLYWQPLDSNPKLFEHHQLWYEEYHPVLVARYF